METLKKIWEYELLKVAGVEADYAGLDEFARIALLRRELATNRPLGTRFSEYSEEKYFCAFCITHHKIQIFCTRINAENRILMSHIDAF